MKMIRNLVLVLLVLSVQNYASAQLDETEGLPYNSLNFSGIDTCNTDITCVTGSGYRTANGACNNQLNPALGMSFRQQARFIGPSYEDGVNYPRFTPDLPSAREVSNKLFDGGKDTVLFSDKHTVQLMAWGQFLCHDVVATPMADATLNCCGEDSGNPECFPIPIPEGDNYFNGTTCMEFVRSAAANTSCTGGIREQINVITSFIDGSQIYGSTDEQMAALRDPEGGTLKTKDGDLLPENPTGHCLKDTSTEVHCQLAGDDRVDEAPNLSLNHLLFVRLHNYLAEELAVINPGWSNDILFQESRKIVGAILQHVTYNEYLPNLIGQHAMQRNLLFSNKHANCKKHAYYYDDSVDPTIRNEFAAAALRIGHTQIMPNIGLMDGNYSTMITESLPTLFFNTFFTTSQNGSNMDELTRWLTHEPCMETDRFFEPEIRNKLFQSIQDISHDLPARNIQRGRDHGVPAYNDYRRFCGLSEMDFSDDIIADHDKSCSDIIKTLYKTEDEIDLYAGAVSELPAGNGLLGPTFQCIFIRQFQALKFGDSFWYEGNRSGFTKAQIKSIKKVKLASLFCKFFNLSEIQWNVFRIKSESNPLIPCHKFPQLNLDLW